MKVKFYGTRGSLPAPITNQQYAEKVQEILENFLDNHVSTKEEIPGFIENLPEYLRYTSGGDTTCISVTSNSGKIYMVDSGTGARNMGYDLMRTDFGKGKGNLDIFYTHTHWDHVQGLPFFIPIYIPGNVLNFYAPFPDLEARLVRQMEKEFFPVPFAATASTKNFKTINKEEVLSFEDGMKISFTPLKHPGGSHAYKFQEGGKTFIFATDCEFTGNDMELIRNMSSFFNGADVLVIDSQYTLDESFNKFDWGHTAYTMAVNCATIWNIETLFLTHHEPAYTDKKVYGILDEAIEHKRHLGGSPLEIKLAREGYILDL